MDSIHEISLPVEELNGLGGRNVSKKVFDMPSEISQSILIEESKPNKKIMT